MGKKLYVGNLPYSIKDKDLEELFKSVGNVVSAKIIVDFESGRSKGFGFCEMQTEEEATTAIKTLDGTDCQGRHLKISEAKPRVDRTR
jgi:cold-inducible RNA-binding protein